MLDNTFIQYQSVFCLSIYCYEACVQSCTAWKTVQGSFCSYPNKEMKDTEVVSSELSILKPTRNNDLLKCSYQPEHKLDFHKSLIFQTNQTMLF